jgi:uncharacterized protein with ATP-grasp and redox domains
MAGKSEKVQDGLQRKMLSWLAAADWSRNPPFIATQLFRRTYRALGTKDPYARVKKEYNNKVLALYPRSRRLLRTSADPLATALRLALAGNIIDFGILEQFDLGAVLQQTLAMPLAPAKVRKFRERARAASRILYIADNAGEIGLDRFLIEEIRRVNPAARVTLAVKKTPNINDATLEDARFFQLEDVAELIDTGGNWIGTHVHLCAPRFQKTFRQADLIVSKGQANYEALEDRRDPRIVFLLRAKCPVVARMLRVALDTPVIA